MYDDTYLCAYTYAYTGIHTKTMYTDEFIWAMYVF